MTIHQRFGKAALQRRPPKRPHKPTSQALGGRHIHRRTHDGISCLCLVADPEPLIGYVIATSSSTTDLSAQQLRRFSSTTDGV